MWTAPSWLLLPLVVIGACAGPGDDRSPSPAALDRGPVPPDAFEAAVADASVRAAIDRGGLSVVSAEAVIWPDGSVGCPEPGMMYTQALVPGYRVVLAAGEVRYAYHGARNGQLTFCPPERAQEPAAGGDT